MAGGCGGSHQAVVEAARSDRCKGAVVGSEVEVAGLQQ